MRYDDDEDDGAAFQEESIALTENKHNIESEEESMSDQIRSKGETDDRWCGWVDFIEWTIGLWFDLESSDVDGILGVLAAY